MLTQQTIDEKVALAVNKSKAETKEELKKIVDARVVDMNFDQDKIKCINHIKYKFKLQKSVL